MLIPIGPVAVFGASNFPLAFSVAGGDTISALAAGNSVVVKAHPAHPGTCELVARAIQNALTFCRLPLEIFSMVQGTTHEVGLQLVQHPLIKAVGFTGSLKGGRALFDAAAARPEPIPVYAEMGSTNPVFVLPGALAKNESALAQGLIQSVTMGVGQFCTNPGLVFGVKSQTFDSFIENASKSAKSVPAGTMLHGGICKRFHEGLRHVEKTDGVRVAGRSETSVDETKAPAVVFTTDADTFAKNVSLSEELFGPSTLIVTCPSAADLESIAQDMPGQLTATVHGTEEDLAQHAKLIAILAQKVGRLVCNSFPTGVEVCASMHHGGPYPATTDARSTSVGCYAVKRFARPITFQGFPDGALPPELMNQNGRNIWRLVDGQLTKSDC
jgi:NADP-dependent aldehyde dehydrogenase